MSSALLKAGSSASSSPGLEPNQAGALEAESQVHCHQMSPQPCSDLDRTCAMLQVEQGPWWACAPQDSHSPLQTFHSLTQHPETPLFMTDMARASGKCSPKLRRTSLKQDVSVAACYACNAGDPGSIPGLGRSPGEGKGYPLQVPWWPRRQRISLQ